MITFKKNLNVLFRERLKIQKGPKMKITFTFLFFITRSAVYEMIHLKLHLNEECQFNFFQQEMNILESSSSDML